MLHQGYFIIMTEQSIIIKYLIYICLFALSTTQDLEEDYEERKRLLKRLDMLQAEYNDLKNLVVSCEFICFYFTTYYYDCEFMKTS